MSQDPHAERYRRGGELFRQKDYPGALEILDELIAVSPNAAQLHFQRARCLQVLDRPEEAVEALERTLTLAPTHVPALLARVELARSQYEEFDTLPLLQKAINLEPDNAAALYQFAHAVLDYGEENENPSMVEQALSCLNRSIELDPRRADAWSCRGRRYQLRAHELANGGDVVRDALGICYDRGSLEQALADLERAADLGEDIHNYRICAQVAALLGQNERAVAHLDRVLERLPAGNTAAREFIQTERDRYIRGDAGAREDLAQMLESASASEAVERNLEEDMGYALTHASAELVRQGMDLQSALTILAGDESPEDLQATQIAYSLYATAHEPDPDLVEVNPAEFPAFQRKHAQACEKALAPLGYVRLACAEARGISAQQGQRTLLGLFTHPEYGSAAAFAIKPKWPGLLGFLLTFLTGNWKTARMLECATRFEDGFFLHSRVAGVDPFDTSGVRNFPLKNCRPNRRLGRWLIAISNESPNASPKVTPWCPQIPLRPSKTAGAPAARSSAKTARASATRPTTSYADYWANTTTDWRAGFVTG